MEDEEELDGTGEEGARLGSGEATSVRVACVAVPDVDDALDDDDEGTGEVDEEVEDEFEAGLAARKLVVARLLDGAAPVLVATRLIIGRPSPGVPGLLPAPSGLLLPLAFALPLPLPPLPVLTTLLRGSLVGCP